MIFYLWPDGKITNTLGPHDHGYNLISMNDPVPYDHEAYRKAQQDLIDNDIRLGCICYNIQQASPNGKAHGRPFIVQRGCPLHSWMLEVFNR